jgi:phage terminase large subunit GpA-like protein
VTVTTRRGFQKLEWQKLRERNEVLDCRVYARAAAWIAGADRWSGAKWPASRTSSGLRPAKPMAIAPGMNRLR